VPSNETFSRAQAVHPGGGPPPPTKGSPALVPHAGRKRYAKTS
jgi:hypothetical protein